MNLGIQVLEKRFQEEKQSTQAPKESVSEKFTPKKGKLTQGTRSVINGMKDQNKRVNNFIQNNSKKALGLRINEAYEAITENIQDSSFTYKRNLVNPFTNKKGAKQSAVKLGTLNKITQENTPKLTRNGVVKTQNPELIKAQSKKMMNAFKMLQASNQGD